MSKNNQKKIAEKPSSHVDISFYIKNYGWRFLIFFILVFLTYGWSINNGFISDDNGLVTDSSKLASLNYIFEFPATILRRVSDALVYLAFGNHPWAYRSFSFLFHFGNVSLVYLLIKKFVRWEIAFFTAALLAAHPMISEPVYWISGGNYVQYTFFFLLGFYLYILTSKPSQLVSKYVSNNILYILSLISFLVATLTTNRLMALPLLFVYEISYGNLKKNWKKLIPIVLFGVLWLAEQAFAVGGVAEGIEKTNSTTTYNSFIQIPFAIAFYIKMAFWPIALSFYHSTLDASPLALTIDYLILIVSLSLLIYGYFKRKFLFFSLAIFFFGLWTTLTPFGVAWVVAERYSYLASIGLFATLTYLFFRLAKSKTLKIISYSLLSLIIILLSARTIVRGFDWKDEKSLFLAILKVYPNDSRAQNYAATLNFESGNEAVAKKGFEDAIAANPTIPDPYYNLGNYYKEQKDYRMAISYYNQALIKDPKYYHAYQNLANSYYFLGNVDLAIENNLKALEIHPDPDVYVNLAVFYMKKNDVTKAKDAFQKALQLDPKNAHAQEGLEQIQFLSPSPKP